MHYFLTVPTNKALEVITAIVNNPHLTKITSIVAKNGNTLVFFDSQYTKRYLCCNSGLSIFNYNLQTVQENYNYLSDTSMHD